MRGISLLAENRLASQEGLRGVSEKLSDVQGISGGVIYTKINKSLETGGLIYVPT